MLGIGEGELPRDKERGVVLVEVREPRLETESLVLRPETRETLKRIVSENSQAALLTSHGLMPTRKVLFCGPPGCGKTVAAEAVAKALSLPLIVVRFDAVVSSYLGETASNIRKVFQFARTRPMVLLFDEFDAIGKKRTDPEEHGELKRVVNSFLQLMDAFQGDAVTIAATNHQMLLDPALWRRFDEIVWFEMPDTRAVHELLVRNLRQTGTAPSVRLAQYAKRLSGMSCADVERVAVDAVKITVLKGEGKVKSAALDAALARLRRRAAITAKSSTTRVSRRK